MSKRHLDVVDARFWTSLCWLSDRDIESSCCLENHPSSNSSLRSAYLFCLQDTSAEARKRRRDGLAEGTTEAGGTLACVAVPRVGEASVLTRSLLGTLLLALVVLVHDHDVNERRSFELSHGLLQVGVDGGESWDGGDVGELCRGVVHDTPDVIRQPVRRHLTRGNLDDEKLTSEARGHKPWQNWTRAPCQPLSGWTAQSHRDQISTARGRFREHVLTHGMSPQTANPSYFSLRSWFIH